MAGGTGFFWKGLGDSFNGFRDYKFKKDLQNDEIGTRMNEGVQDRASREYVAGIQHGDAQSALKYDSIERAARGLSTLAYNKSKLADALETGQLGMEPSREQLTQARKYREEATEHENQAAAMLSGLQSAYGPAFKAAPGSTPPPPPSFMDTVRSMIAKKQGSPVLPPDAGQNTLQTPVAESFRPTSPGGAVGSDGAYDPLYSLPEGVQPIGERPFANDKSKKHPVYGWASLRK